jgi:excisionase family DNA binding protein
MTGRRRSLFYLETGKARLQSQWDYIARRRKSNQPPVAPAQPKLRLALLLDSHEPPEPLTPPLLRREHSGFYSALGLLFTDRQVVNRPPFRGGPPFLNIWFQNTELEMQNVEQQFYSLAEVARVLGFEKSTLYSRAKEGRIRTVVIDGAKRVPRSELLRYIGAATQPAHAAE